MLGKLADSLYGGGVGLLAGVRNLLPTNQHLPLTRLVEALMANKPPGGGGSAAADKEADKYLYFDPKAPAGSSRHARNRVQGAFKESVVFVLGGGNYSEYQNLQDWQRDNQANLGVNSVGQSSTHTLFHARTCALSLCACAPALLLARHSLSVCSGTFVAAFFVVGCSIRLQRIGVARAIRQAIGCAASCLAAGQPRERARRLKEKGSVPFLLFLLALHCGAHTFNLCD
jgi:hypothetical protein